MAKKNKTADPGPKKETFEGRKDAGDFKKARAAPGASEKGWRLYLIHSGRPDMSAI